MALFGLVFLVVALVLIGVGLAIGLVACCIAAMLVALGVLSSSVLVGLLSHRPSVGFRAFLLQCGVLAGAPAGAVCAWLAHSIFASYGSDWLILVYGALGGALTGIGIALLLAFISDRVQRWARARLGSGKSRAAISEV
jgi:hypothetical protein